MLILTHYIACLYTQIGWVVLGVGKQSFEPVKKSVWGVYYIGEREEGERGGGERGKIWGPLGFLPTPIPSPVQSVAMPQTVEPR